MHIVQCSSIRTTDANAKSTNAERDIGDAVVLEHDNSCQ